METYPSSDSPSDSDLDLLDEKAFEVLERCGLHMPDGGWLKRMEVAGYPVDYSANRVRFPRERSEEALALTPREITLGGREAPDDRRLNASSLHVRPQSGCPRVLDLYNSVCRPPLLDDVVKMARLNDALTNIDLAATLLYPQDIVAKYRDAAALVAVIENTSKHVYVQPYDAAGMKRMAEIALAIRGSKSEVARRPPFTAILGVTSPLVFSPNELGVVENAAEYGIPIMCGSTPMGGATSPVDLAGEIVLQHAENLAGLIVIQIAQPGTPATYAIRPSVMDMRSGASVWGAVEWSMMSSALLPLARRRGFLTDVVGLTTDSKRPDSQAGAEKGVSASFAGIYGVNVVAGAGFLETIMTGDYAQLVIDNDLAQSITRIRKGIDFSDLSRAVESIVRIGPGGNYLAEDQTMEHMRDIVVPGLFDRENRANWEANGSREAAESARSLAQRTIENHRPDELPGSVVAEIRRIAGLN